MLTYVAMFCAVAPSPLLVRFLCSGDVLPALLDVADDRRKG